MKDAVMQEFVRYLAETFEEDYDPQDARHLIYFGVFKAGWDAREEAEKV